jgi:hypothetical protein
MSLSPNTGYNFLSDLFNRKKRPAYAEMRYATGKAAKDIENIAIEAFFILVNNRIRDAKDAMELNIKTIGVSAVKITAILNAISGGKGVDWDRAASLIDHAIWGLMIMVSTRGDSPLTDSAAAYVMIALLFPLKCDTMRHDCDSLLYKTVRYSDFKFGSAVLLAVVSRNDQLFRASELADTGAIRLFEERYNTKLGEWGIAKM